MSSEHPPDSSGKPGVRQSLRSGFHRAKGAFKRSPDSSPPSAHQQSLGTPSLGSHNVSFFNRSNPGLVRPPSSAGSDQRTIAAPPPTQAPILNTGDDTATGNAKSDSASWDRLTSSLRILESSVELFPPLKSAVGAVIVYLDVVQNAASNRADYKELTDEFQSMADMLNQYAGELESEPNNGSIANIAQCIERQVADIERKGESGTVERLLDASQDQEDVIRRFRQVERPFRQLQHDLSMRTRTEVKKQLETARLHGLFPVDDAKYNSGYSTTIRRRACTANTREAIHQYLQNWTTSPDSEKIFWMNGMAGTGKTTIAYSFCEWLEQTNRLGASFFCSRISSTCRSLNHIVPTLAYQLARFSPGFRSNLYRVLNENPDAGKLNVVQQFEKLINRPMLSAKDAIPDSVVIVIDALDECDDNYSVRMLLDLLLKFAENLPLKFFVSSRPEPMIRERMMSQGGASRSIVHLHDIEESIVEEDIKKYLTEALSPMTPPPSVRQIELLAKRSRNLFIYAATVVRYIYPDDVSVDSSSRLESVLEAISAAKGIGDDRYEDLDLLYTTVLTAIFESRLSRLSRDEKDYMRRVLSTVVCAWEPVTAVTIASLAVLTEHQVWSALHSLRSVIHVSENNNLISTLHASFPEYMLDESRSKEYCCNESKSNERMAHRCFDIMRSELRFNICGLENSYLTDDQVDDLESRVTQCISPTLSYACRYWSSHLRVAPALDDTRDMILDFLFNRLLFWMEVLSVSRCIGIGAPMMQQAKTWLRMENKYDEIQKRVSDARNFVTWFAANPCSGSTPHIYISSLPLCAKSSWVYQHYFQRTTGLASISISQYDEAVLAVWTTESPVFSVAISPDGNRIASGSADGIVRVYDVHTGAVVAGPFQGHSDPAYSVSFSPDGRYIASGSYDCTVIIWDSHTGIMVTGPLHKHTDAVWSVAFSPDGRHLVSGSWDSTIVVWDVSTGAIALGPLQGHSDYVISVSFSPDSQLIASSSGDKTIRLWDASTGVALAGPLIGHKGDLNAVAFSSDGNQLASCSDDETICVWDIQTGTMVGSPFEGHKGSILSVSFSHNNNWIVSGGLAGYNNIIVWDAHTGSIILGPLSGHMHHVGSVVFTPDDTRIVSCSDDKTIRIWDVQPEHQALGQQNTHEHSVGPIAFSRNGTQFISSSSNNIFQLWDIHTGMTIPHKFEGPTEVTTIHPIALSSQLENTLVAVGTNDLTIRVWNVHAGKVVPLLLTGHKDIVRCLTFSPNGFYICSGSDDTTIIVWDIDTGAMFGHPYTGHTGAVISVAYSPDATRIVSGSTDCTVKIWDSSTGALAYTLNKHNAPVSSVAFSPGGNLIVSGSVDGSTRKWEVGAVDCSSQLSEPAESSDPDSDSNSNSDQSTSDNCVCFSPNGTCIASGFRSGIHLFDAQSTKHMSKINLPRGERVRWIGCSPDGTDIISVSVLEGADVQTPPDDPTQPLRPSSNIIRVWRAVLHPNQPASTPHDWLYKSDGRIVSPEGLVMWIPPDLIPHIKAQMSVKVQSHYSPLVMSSDGFINVGYPDLCIGNRWTECYVHKN